MKRYISAPVCFSLLLLTLPALPVITVKSGEDTPKESIVTSADTAEAEITVTEAVTSATEAVTAAEEPTEDIFLLLCTDSGEILTLTAEEYITGTVMAEMPAAFHEEALKAQAVAAYTYAVRQRETAIKTAPEELCGAHISDDSGKFQAYFTEADGRAFYGERYEEYYEKIRSAVRAVAGEMIIYEGEPIVAAFHSLSGGRTESAEVVWGNKIDYLVPTESAGDMDAPKFMVSEHFSEEDIKAAFPQGDFSGEPSRWIDILKRSESGTVIKMTVGGEEMSGARFRSALSLRSANFTAEYLDGEFIVTTKGYGHGVGMSQYGADAMARDGAGYREILRHYYPGTVIVKS